MTAVATLAGAPTDGVADWASINWQKVNRNVRRLQARIVKAVGQVHSLGLTVLQPRPVKGALAAA